MKKEEKESEIEALKMRVDDLSQDIDKYINKRNKRIEKSSTRKYNKKYVWILICLIIIILIIDIVSLFVYYKPDLSSFMKSNNSSSALSNNKPGISNKCSDGTAEGTCSKTKPMFCYIGTLIKKSSMCGCPTGYKQDFQDCVKA